MEWGVDCWAIGCAGTDPPEDEAEVVNHPRLGGVFRHYEWRRVA